MRISGGVVVCIRAHLWEGTSASKQQQPHGSLTLRASNNTTRPTAAMNARASGVSALSSCTVKSAASPETSSGSARRAASWAAHSTSAVGTVACVQRRNVTASSNPRPSCAKTVRRRSAAATAPCSSPSTQRANTPSSPKLGSSPRLRPPGCSSSSCRASAGCPCRTSASSNSAVAGHGTTMRSAQASRLSAAASSRNESALCRVDTPSPASSCTRRQRGGAAGGAAGAHTPAACRRAAGSGRQSRAPAAAAPRAGGARSCAAHSSPSWPLARLAP